MRDEESMKIAAKEMFAPVKDKPGFFAEMMAFMAKQGGMDMTSQMKGSTLKDVKMDGDNATALFVKGDGEKEEEKHFVKRNGKWYLSHK